MTSLRTVGIAALAQILVVLSSHGAEPQSPPNPAVATALEPYLTTHKLAGFIGIVADREGTIRYRNTAGYADVEARKPLTEDNLFWVASMSKMFVGASIMMLVDEGKLALDDPATKFIPEFDRWRVVTEQDAKHTLLKPLTTPVTLRHLLSHTAGLEPLAELQHLAGADTTSIKARSIPSVTGPLQSQPGQRYAYGNQGMNIAARIVEIVSGMSYEDFLQQRFFDPLGMKDTGFWPSEARLTRLAGAYGPNQDGSACVRGDIWFLTKPYSDRARRFPEPGGGLFSTTGDILRYGLMLANNGELAGKRYLSPAAMDELRKEQTGTTKVNYSLGYHLRNGMFGHDGAYGTDLSVNPVTGMIAIFMVQCTSGDQWQARDAFLEKAAEALGSAE
ncbi:beta-lactamase family protein [Luteolibacter sp. GHJ8]|uniref:Beta-lactamase family protein n=1 Tax=Luteolibacter rhizosphaerae TaxID=2989719 RepID=A0ABT3FYH6_9BACT|nr:serine hydrolase domain-containing protein [Luteolibacter rhizosphaerae]MCW1912467.1 beta-lactamase family protein [Luteolibacter rhizosphaerae]